jgi:polyketide biosynthesis enoyl-CoA hydratase PksH
VNGAYETLRVEAGRGSVTVTLDRPEQRNSINIALLRDLSAALERAEQDPDCRVVILEGQGGVFCTGLDFGELHRPETADPSRIRAVDDLYMALLDRLTSSSKVVVAKVDGQVMAGGVGLVAASDVVIATERSEFSLSEALWGLLPACVAPFLIRRVGFQRAYWMTLTAQRVTAREALADHLVDEVADKIDDALRKTLIRLCRLEETTVRDLKAYFRKMWIVDAKMQETAVAEIRRLLLEPRVRENVRAFVEERRFPWDRRE